MKPLLIRALREPLTQFVLLGAVLFRVYALVGNGRPDPPGEIVVTGAQVEQLAIGFSRTWQRPPTEEELNGLVEDYIREEVFYREAMAMGLDRDDTIVRRRLRQKLEFLTEDMLWQASPPTEQELQKYLEQHADGYREEPRLSFEHIFFSRERRGLSAEAAARRLVAQLNGKHRAAVNLDREGDPSLLPLEMRLSTESEIARLFGGDFGEQLKEIESGRWAGPLESSYGLHLVFVRERVPGPVPELDRIRDAVLRDLLGERRRQALDAAYGKFRRGYTVVMEQGPPRVAEVR